MPADAKRTHEAEVFREFLAASRLPIDSISIESLEPPRPDIRCTAQNGTCLFELAEILWQDPEPKAGIASLAHGLALSECASDEKVALVAAGQFDEAEKIQTCGGFDYPALASLIQVLAKKCAKHYTTDGLQLCLLLYYERQDPIEPFEWLTERYRDVVRVLLAASQFSVVWLYHHAVAHSFSLSGPQFSGLPARVALRAFAVPESCRRVVGRICMIRDEPLILFDASYNQRFFALSDALTEARNAHNKGSAERSLKERPGAAIETFGPDTER